MTVEIPDWVLTTPSSAGIHTEPPRTGGDILPPFTWQQMQEYFAQFMNAFLAQVAIALGGIEIAGWKPFEFLSWWGENSLQNGDPLNAADLFNLIASELIPGLDATKIVSGLFPQDMIDGLEDDLSSIWDGIANAGGEILEPIEQWLMPLVPVSSVGLFEPELLANPNYEGDESIDGGPDWVWDGAVNHDFDGSGSVRVTCDGTQHQLFSDPPIPVAPKQAMGFAHYLKWSGITGSGICFKLAVATYNGATLVGTIDLQAVNNPITNQGSWVPLQGTYVIPDAGVDNIRLLLIVTSSATAGTVWWDSGSVKKKQLFFQNFTTALEGDLGNLFTQVSARALITDLTDLMSTLGGNLTQIGNRFFNIGAGGGFNSAALTNMSGFPGIDSSKILSGVLNIFRIPTSDLNRNNIFDLGGVLDNITNAFLGTGSQFGATTNTQARGSMDQMFGEVVNATSQLQALRSNNTGANVSGVNVTEYFDQFPDGPMPASWTVTYSGSGSSQIGIANGEAGWRIRNNDGNRNAMVMYNPGPTNTDFQIVRGTLTSPPPEAGSGGLPRIAAVGRANAADNPTSYIWARGYCTGFLAYKGDIGCTVDGVETVWVSNVALTWSMDINIVIGLGAQPRRYQVYSGSKLVIDYTEVGTVSRLGAGYRYWGCRTEMKTNSGGPNCPPTIAATSVSDNAPPDVVGSGAHMVRTSAATVAMATGVNAVPPNFFQVVRYNSADIIYSLTNGSFMVTYDGWYHVDQGLGLNGLIFEDWNLFLFVNGVGVKAGGIRSDDHRYASAHWSVYLKAGDTVQAGYYRESGSNAVMTGEATGTWTYLSIALLNRSYA